MLSICMCVYTHSHAHMRSTLCTHKQSLYKYCFNPYVNVYIKINTYTFTAHLQDISLLLFNRQFMSVITGSHPPRLHNYLGINHRKELIFRSGMSSPSQDVCYEAILARSIIRVKRDTQCLSSGLGHTSSDQISHYLSCTRHSCTERERRNRTSTQIQPTFSWIFLEKKIRT